MSALVVVGLCLVGVAVAFCIGVACDVAAERAAQRRDRRRPGYVEIPRGTRRLP